jgi:5-methylcytosine-specific restriction protein B
MNGGEVMARYPEFETLFQVFQDLAKACFVDDRSFLWPERQLWTSGNIATLKHVLIEAPVLGEETFEEKLDIQMSGQPQELWGLLADIYFLFCLVPSSRKMKPDTKRIGVIRLAQRSGLPIPDENAQVWKAFERGFCTPGRRYMQKYRQFWLILLFAEQVKKLNDRRSIFKDRLALQETLDDCLDRVLQSVDRAYDLRHGILYLAFPDFYEPIVSTSDRKKIIETFKHKLSIPVPVDTDQALYDIHQSLAKSPEFTKPIHFYNSEIKPIWDTVTVSPPPPPEPPILPLLEPVAELVSLFQLTKNIIIYGPPGTGKTYIANLTANELIKDQLRAPVPEAVQLQSIAEVNTFYDLLAIAMYTEDKDKHFTVKELLDLPLTQARFAVRPVKNEKESIWAHLQSHTAPESKTVKTGYKSEPFLFDKDGESRWFLTSIGIGYVTEALNDALISLQQPQKEVGKAGDFITRVAFHQSYAYEDFVEGFRPTEDNKIEIVPGKFREICSQAAGNRSSKYVLIIDEINRGNISKIFGELITLLEDDKRERQPASFPIELAYSHTRFTVPENLYIIGTMNTADRSIALLDVALRRRFAFYELLPDPTLLNGKMIVSEEGDMVDLEKLLEALNERICKELDADHQVGHSYFMKVKTISELEFAWNNQILPLLREYFYSQPDRLKEILEPYIKGQENSDVLQLEGSDLVVALSQLAK